MAIVDDPDSFSFVPSRVDGLDAVSRVIIERTQITLVTKVIAQALHNYHDTYKMFPSAITYGSDGTPMHRWRVLVSPFVLQGAFYDTDDRDEA